MSRISSRLAGLSLSLLLIPALGAAAQNLRERGDSLLQAGRFDDARALGLAGLQANPNDVDASILVCEGLLGLGRSDDAINYASKAWERRNDPRLAELLGQAYFGLGRNATALSWLRFYLAALPEGPQAASALYMSGEIYLRLGRYGHADMAISTALFLSPGNATWWSRLAWAQEKAGDFRQALASYESALGIDPRLDDAVIGRARVLARLRG
ncbi:MAG TPA: tetratricopeptide repeat protein [Rectinemataceae bacterium]|nr:tetratricopeptide repeat protein [Rectinemataceae bacterium]